MSLIKRNIAANLVGSAWVALISIAFIPLYIRFMGVESYGLIGFYVTLQALFAVLDLGLSATVSRELARLSALPNEDQRARNLVRSLEVVYLGIAFLIVIITTQLAPWIATEWLSAGTLSDESLEMSIVLMGLIIALRLPYGFYSGGLLGLQHQVLLNAIRIIFETSKSGGAVLVLWLISPSIISFFVWNLAVSAIGTLLVGIVLWRKMPRGKVAQFRFDVIGRIWRFAAGMSGIAILASILTQADKVVLSKMLSLENFAYYMLAATVSMGLYVIITPVFSAIYPRFTQLVACQDEAALTALYHKSCQFMTALVMPAALIICFFAQDILRLWTMDVSVAHQTAPILSLLIIGTAFNGMMNIPYALQLANGWTSLALYMNAVAILVLIPMVIFFVDIYGARGGAIGWLVLNTGYILFGLRLMHKRLLTGELTRWMLRDFGLPAISALVIVASFWAVRWDGMNNLLLATWIFMTYGLSLLAAVSVAPVLRQSIWSWINVKRQASV